jgi:hemerythrin-like metal-binding protein
MQCGAGISRRLKAGLKGQHNEVRTHPDTGAGNVVLVESSKDICQEISKMSEKNSEWSGANDGSAPTPPGDNNLSWSDARLLGFTQMDEVHKEFYAVTLKLVTCTDATAEAAIDEFERHAISHFEQEDEWMRSTNFPSRDCHIDEHAAVLTSVGEVKEAVGLGRAGAELVRDIGMHLFDWFPGHADYLDSALAAWMTKRTMGGKPVVLRRKI